MSCYKYWGKLEEIGNKLYSYGNLEKYGDSALDDVNIDEIIEILDEVEIIAHDKTIDFDSAKHILDDEKMNKTLKLIRKFYVYVGARLETENALKILESDNPTETLDSFQFYNRYIGLIENESQLAKFNRDKTFVFLGSGPLPLTLIMFNKVFACNCIGIEQNPEVAELSRKVLKRLNFDEEIEIIVGDETTIEKLDYDILMVAALAEPKERVFSNIWEYVDKNTPVIYRTYTGMRALLYSPVLDKDTRGFHKEITLFPSGKTNNTSVLIRKIE
ncbi:nicotianamine synthase family protein [uncultured Methanobrevibacter sp.]|uniref:nicotianamine synthase family protein n=1 Tax=uncultured Methanobrevibacter sp. TaxID=253161 RepID=UPI0025DA88A9|nr:nicotianamine synthase family protein [uncultured Methanobrevibacter sp.]